jgi:hypothetical protein
MANGGINSLRESHAMPKDDPVDPLELAISEGHPVETDDLALAVHCWISALAKEGYRVPFTVLTVGVNGACALYRLTAPPPTQQLSTHELSRHGDGKMALPLNFLLIDSRGEVARLVLDADHRLRPVC